MKNSIVILTGGGPAPGINTVVGSIAKTFISNGYRVLGLHGGYKGLFSKEPNFSEIDFALADTIFNKGGSYLIMSRYKPTQKDFDENFNLSFFRENNIKLLVTVGGDDTASTANRVAKFLSDSSFNISNIHVPKTIDNDLPLPNEAPTFGYQSANAEGTRIATTIYEDAKTSANWFVVSAMGRSAGHLAFSIGTASHYPMIVIPEMFNKTKITLDKIVKLSISSIVKRKLSGRPYGAIMISEGVFHELDSEELKLSGIKFSYDDHGHPELGKVSKSHIFSELLEKEFQKLNLNTKIRPVEIGYEVRCQDPIAFDLVYCTNLGLGVYELFSKGETGCLVFIDGNGNIVPLYLKDLQDPETGKIPPRGVNINSGKVKAVFDSILDYITPNDYEKASSILTNPQEYDFKKILNW